MLYLIGLGLKNKNSITLEGSEAIKKCKEVYLENYTSKLETDDFEFKKVDRNFIENFDVKKAKDTNIAILIIGDVFSATTHFSLYNDCIKNNIEVEVINNASILTAVGITGLELYKFGKTASIPFNNENIKTPIEILKSNQSINAHTLFLLDLDPKTNKFLSVKEAINYLKNNNIKDKVLICSKLGHKDFKIKYGYDNTDFPPPACLIIPSKKLHFMEEEALEKWK